MTKHEFPGLRVVLWKQQSLAGSVQESRDFSNSIRIVTSLIFSLLLSGQKALSAQCRKRAGPTAFCKFTNALSFNCHGISSVQFLSCVQLFATPWTAAPHASLSPTPRVYSNSRPLSRWCHPAISSSVVLFSSCPQSLLALGSFPMSQLFSWSGQSIGVSASASVLPMNTQDWSPSGWTGWISLQSKGLSRAFSNTTVQKHQFVGAQLSSQPSSHIHTWLPGKP